jgi:hypothetical protein
MPRFGASAAVRGARTRRARLRNAGERGVDEEGASVGTDRDECFHDERASSRAIAQIRRPGHRGDLRGARDGIRPRAIAHGTWVWPPLTLPPITDGRPRRPPTRAAPWLLLQAAGQAKQQSRRRRWCGDKPEAHGGVLIAANRRVCRGRIFGLGLAERVGAGGEVGVEASSLCGVEGGEHLFLHGGHSR